MPQVRAVEVLLVSCTMGSGFESFKDGSCFFLLRVVLLPKQHLLQQISKRIDLLLCGQLAAHKNSASKELLLTFLAALVRIHA